MLVMKRAVFLAIVTMLAGGVLIILDLGSPQSMIYPIISPNPASPLWWMGIFYFLYLVLLLVEFYLITKNDGTKLRVLSVFTAFSAIAVHSTLGGIFGFASVRSYFGGALSPVYFILIAMVIGTALLLFVTILQYKLTRTTMSAALHDVVLDIGRFLGVVLGVVIFLTIWKDLVGIHSTVATTALAYQHILATWWYWVLVILIGLVIPVFLLLNPRTRNLNVIALASVLVLIGMFTARVEFTTGGQIVPVVADLRHLAYPLGSYSPTFVEIAVEMFAFAGAALVYTFGARKLELEKVPQHD
jgi:molybdopterin-containing oxidoreductase family membrane subunit